MNFTINLNKRYDEIMNNTNKIEFTIILKLCRFLMES